MSAATVILIRRKRLVARFRDAGATDLKHAVMLESLGEHRILGFRSDDSAPCVFTCVQRSIFHGRPSSRRISPTAPTTGTVYRSYPDNRVLVPLVFRVPLNNSSRGTFTVPQASKVLAELREQRREVEERLKQK